MPSSFQAKGGDLAFKLNQIGGRSVKVVNDAMEAAMTKVKEEAQKRVPEDNQDLMWAIRLEKEDRRRSWTVGVDDNARNDTGGTVGQYAMRIHEGIPDYKLGPGSIAKEVPNKGRKFIENPFREIIDQKLIDELSEVLITELRRRDGK